MSNSPYHYLDRLIEEFEEDSRTIKTDKLIMRNYPKVFVMTVASTFERQLKQRCQNFIDYPLSPLTTYTNLASLMHYCSTKNIILVDSIFGKFHTFNKTTGLVNLDATKFYDLFGGFSFKNDVEIIFNNELASRISMYQDIVDKLLPLVESGEQYERDYVRYDDILARLKICSFTMAESAFLNLKQKRNQVAHDYISGLSDSFNDLNNFYLDAVVYVISLEKAIENLTNVSAIPSFP